MSDRDDMTPAEQHAELGVWKCHKIVRAGEIIAVSPIGAPISADGHHSVELYLRRADDPMLAILIKRPCANFRRYWPNVGDYFVVYEDGYESVSPRAAFLEGYDLMQNVTIENSTTGITLDSTTEQLDAAIAARPSPIKVTKDYMLSRCAEVKFHKLGPTLTHCTIHLDNGYQVTGESACVDPANYDRAIGEKLAYDRAFQKLWPLFGFALCEAQFVGTDLL